MAAADNNLAITNFRRIDRNHLLASFDVEIVPWHLQLCGCTWHFWETTGYERINFPSKEWTGNDGKKHYSNIVKFTDENVEKRFQEAVLAELRKHDANLPTR